MSTIPLKAVVFDLDGLLANTEDIYELAGDELLRRRGKDHSAELREQMMGRPALEALEVMRNWHSLGDALEDLAVESRELVYQYLESHLDFMPGLEELLDELEKASIPKAVATSATREYASQLLARLGIVERFEFVLTSEDVTLCKPAPDVYLLAAQRLGVRPEEIMVLEDSANGCRAAVAAGACVVAVPNRHTQAHAFDGVNLVAESLADRRIRALLQLAE